MDTLSSHYARLLGVDDSWRVEIRLVHVGSGVFCPECGQSCGLADHAEERRWRHLDTMQFTTELVARLPRCRCPEHGAERVNDFETPAERIYCRKIVQVCGRLADFPAG